MSNFGLVQVYTGDGKGKTTSAIGAGIRALGHGYKVCMIQFMKGGPLYPQYGEIKVLEKMSDFKVFQFGVAHFKKNKDEATEEEKRMIDQALQKSCQVTASGEFDLVILDEINVACYFDLLEVDKILNLLNEKAAHTEVILTGRGADSQLIERADLVTEIKDVKHPLQEGKKAREGIEY